MRTSGFAKIYDTLPIAVCVLDFLCIHPLQKGQTGLHSETGGGAAYRLHREPQQGVIYAGQRTEE